MSATSPALQETWVGWRISGIAEAMGCFGKTGMRMSAGGIFVTAWALVALALPGCSSKPTTAECEQVADNLAAVAVRGQNLEQREALKELLEGLRPQVVKTCENKYSRAKARCLIRAEDKAQADACG